MDQRLFFLVNGQWAHPALDLPMACLSSWAFWWPIAALAGIALLVFGGFRGRAALVCVGLAVGLTDGVVSRTIKETVGRPRPYQVLEGVRIVDLQRARPRLLAVAMPPKIEYSRPSIQPVRGKAFPSSHAANNFALAVVIALFFRPWGWLYFLPATLIALSRVYTGSHYPSDVLVGALTGAGVALLVVAAAEALWRRFAPRIVPGLAARHPGLIPP